MSKISFKRLIASVLLSASFALASAQNDNDQLLIFRNTGETNLLWQSQLDSITFTDTDTLGNVYQEPYAQIFHTTDTTLYVPIAEIDSVCFGTRNEIEYHDDVRLLTDEKDICWIISFDGDKIFYRKDTPNDVLPKMGEKVYYAQLTETFPCGLCAQVTDVTTRNEDIAVAITGVENTEIFSKFFFAGTTEDLPKFMTRAGDVDRAEPVIFTLPLGDYGEITTDGSLSVRSDNLVLDIFKHYYHADLRVETSVGFGYKATAKESSSGNWERNYVSVKLPTVAGVFVPTLNIGLFADFNAEMALDYFMVRKNTTHIIWTRKDGKQTFDIKPSNEPKSQQNQANIEVILDGSIYAGIALGIDFNLIGDIVGARAMAKYGVELSGELSIGILNDLSQEYSVEPYHSAELGVKNLLRFEGYALHRSGWLWGDVEVYKFVEYSMPPLWENKIHLFPQYENPRAVKQTPMAREVSTAAKVVKPIASKVETGFQLLNKNNEIIDSLFVKTIETSTFNTDSIQTVDAEIPVPVENKEDSLLVRPVFHYRGHTIPFRTISIAQDPNIQPIIFAGGNGVVTYVSGIPIVGNVKRDSTTYHIGPFLPLAVYDKDFYETSPYPHTFADFIDNDSNNVYGTWTGDVEEISLELALNEDGTGSLKENDGESTPFTYKLNYPQSGRVTLCYEEEELPNTVFDIESIEDDKMKVRFRNSYPTENSYILKRDK